jgi:beta-N-acetylhexosaminidase
MSRVGLAKGAATAKHFPGLGAATTLQNTDLRPVTLALSLGSLRTIDEVPYRWAIAAHVRLVLVSWAVYPAFRTRRPAGLSSRVVRGELRTRLGFDGVTITDALGAGALRAFGTAQRRAVLAAGAGTDLILCASGRVAEGGSALTGLLDAYRNGSLGKVPFQAAVRRITALRSSLGG